MWMLSWGPLFWHVTPCLLVNPQYEQLNQIELHLSACFIPFIFRGLKKSKCTAFHKKKHRTGKSWHYLKKHYYITEISIDEYVYIDVENNKNITVLRYCWCSNYVIGKQDCTWQLKGNISQNGLNQTTLYFHSRWSSPMHWRWGKRKW